MAAVSRRQSIIEALLARVQLIARSNDFQTDAGLTVFLGEVPTLGDDDPAEALDIKVGVERPAFQGVGLFIELPIDINALVKADLEQPWLAVERVIADIKRGVELEDRTLGGLVPRTFTRAGVEAIEREPGSTTVGATVRYLFPFKEGWGNP